MITQEQASGLLDMIRLAYPKDWAKGYAEDQDGMARLWAFALQDVDAELAFVSMMQWISANRHAPSVADIREGIKRIYYEATLAPMSMELTQAQYAAVQDMRARAGWLRGDEKPKLSIWDMVQSAQFSEMIPGGAGETAAIEAAEEKPALAEEKPELVEETDRDVPYPWTCCKRCALRESDGDECDECTRHVNGRWIAAEFREERDGEEEQNDG